MIYAAIQAALGGFLRLPPALRYLIGLAGAGALLWGLWAWLGHREAQDDKHNQDIGATVQREADLRATLERTETANEARREIEQDGPVGDRARYEQCLRTARTPTNCQRLLPERKAH